jgi:hypothetical protein
MWVSSSSEHASTVALLPSDTGPTITSRVPRIEASRCTRITSPLHWVLGLGFEAQTEKSSSDGFVDKLLNPAYTTLTTPRFEHVNPSTSGARIFYSVLPRSLTWSPPLHRLLVHDFILLFLHHADCT